MIPHLGHSENRTLSVKPHLGHVAVDVKIHVLHIFHFINHLLSGQIYISMLFSILFSEKLQKKGLGCKKNKIIFNFSENKIDLERLFNNQIYWRFHRQRVKLLLQALDL
jgi:hypothetical protein